MFENFTTVLLEHEAKQRIVAPVGDALYDKAKACFAIVASGEPRLYGNIIVKEGVINPP